MVYKRAVSPERRAYVKYLVEWSDMTLGEVAVKGDMSRATLYRILHPKISKKSKGKKTGRPRLISERGERAIKQSVVKLRKEKGTVSAETIVANAGIDVTSISPSTCLRTLGRLGYGYLVTRPKGLLNEKDLKRRLRFAKKMKKEKNSGLLEEGNKFLL